MHTGISGLQSVPNSTAHLLHSFAGGETQKGVFDVAHPSGTAAVFSLDPYKTSPEETVFSSPPWRVNLQIWMYRGAKSGGLVTRQKQ